MTTPTTEGGSGPGPIIDEQRPSWTNFHKTVRNTMLRVAQHANIAPDWKTEPAPTWSVNDFAAMVREQQRLLGRQSSEMLVAGAAWSHARLLATDRALLEMPSCCGVLPLEAGDMEDGLSAEGLCLVAGGTRIKQLATWLEPRGQTIRTSGSHGAATLAGAFATGTHGARPGVRGVEDHVRGILLVTGASSAAWLCPEGARSPSAELLRRVHPAVALLADDELFGAVLCHLGALGIVAAVLCEGEPIHRREVVKQVVGLWPGWESDWARGGFDEIAARVCAAARRSRPGWEPPGPLIHCEVNLDPWSLRAGHGNGCFNLRFRADNVPPGIVGAGPQREAIDILYDAVATELDEARFAPLTAPASLNLPRLFELAFRSEQVPTIFSQKIDTPGKLLPADHEQIKRWLQIWSTAVAVPTEQLPYALDAIEEVAAGWPSPSFVACLRPVARSQATLGFCAFEANTVIDFDGLGDQLAPGQIEEASRSIFAQFDRRGVPYRSHWGKLAEPDAFRIASDYGTARLESWHRARATLLDEEGRRLFTSSRLRSCGLA